jgi:ATP-dependent exoDNAse (exonuclease V) alpha subunit
VPGDRVVCRRNDSRVGVDNGTRGTVARSNADGLVLVCDDGRRVSLRPTYVDRDLEHAYCLTAHALQGATVEAGLGVARPRITHGAGPRRRQAAAASRLSTS